MSGGCGRCFSKGSDRACDERGDRAMRGEGLERIVGGRHTLYSSYYQCAGASTCVLLSYESLFVFFLSYEKKI